MIEFEQKMNFELLQNGVKIWTRQNFGKPEDRASHQPLLGVSEEVGELCHAHLKAEQGIRGTPEELEAKAKDAVGDILIYLADYCNLRGFDMQEIIEQTWLEVRKRDWKKNSKTGKTEDDIMSMRDMFGDEIADSVIVEMNEAESDAEASDSVKDVDVYGMPEDEWDPTNCKVNPAGCWCQACDCEDEP